MRGRRSSENSPVKGKAITRKETSLNKRVATREDMEKIVRLATHSYSAQNARGIAQTIVGAQFYLLCALPVF